MNINNTIKPKVYEVIKLKMNFKSNSKLKDEF